MTYSKPEIAVLGEASEVIQGSKSTSIDNPVNGDLNLFSFELED